ncbi:MAG: Trk system potassium transporter TrkA [Halobacteriales archaeon]
MEVIIIGAGQVGESIARSLQRDHHVTLIERDRERAHQIQVDLDILVVEGDGTELPVLEEAGVEDADIILASTDSDEVNIVACASAKAVTDAFTVARVKASKYLTTWRRQPGSFGIDHMVCTDLLTAEEIVSLVGLPAAHDVESFADGLVLMAEFDVYPEADIAGQTVAEADRFDSLTFAAMIDGESVEIPGGDSVIEVGSRVVVIGSPGSIQSFARGLGHNGVNDGDGEVVIVGGTEIGYHVARLLAERDLHTRLIEPDADAARRLAEHLPETRVIRSEATDVGFLEAENLDDADVLVAAMHSSEQNLLECILADGLGIDRTVAVIDDPRFIDVFEDVGVDVAISPRTVVAEEITQFTQGWKTENLALLESDIAEVAEVEITESSPLAGQTIEVGISAVDADIVVGAITRDGSFVRPRGDTVLRPGDHVVIFFEADDADTVIGAV